MTSIFYTVKFSNEKSVVLGNTYPKMVKRYEKMVASYMYGKKLNLNLSLGFELETVQFRKDSHILLINCLLQFYGGADII